MSENKFLRNLSQQNNPSPASSSRAVEPTPPQPVRPPDTTPTEYDPIKRLTDELSRHSRAIEGLNARIDRLEGRPQAATQTEVRALLHEAREGVSYTIDSKTIAQYVLPELTKGMPSAEDIKTAADAGAAQIAAAGNTAADQIERSGSAAAERIRWAGQSKADTFANLIGFTNWKAALLIGLIPMLSGIGLVYLRQENNRQQTEIAGWKSFGLWVSEKYPEVRKVYDKSDQ